MHGSLHCVTAVLERFGRVISGVGDVDGDSLNDWILVHRRCDTAVGAYAVHELLLQHGVRNGLPEAALGNRIGPTEVASNCSFVGAGDYDGDGHRDLALAVHVEGDPAAVRRRIASLVVFWNDGRGGFSLEDTTHLTRPNERLTIFGSDDGDRSPRVPLRCDLNRDGTEDLVVSSSGVRYVDGVPEPSPSIVIYFGHSGSRWGRNGLSIEPDWHLWQKLFTRRVSLLDHDGDGALDIVMYIDDDAIGHRGGVSIIYGRPWAMPDTTYQHVDFVRVDDRDGNQCHYVDVTGDRVPEMIVSTGGVEGGSRGWLVYFGRRGQRLLEQYGSGNDPPRPGNTEWWGKPWTIVKSPNMLNSSWIGS